MQALDNHLKHKETTVGEMIEQELDTPGTVKAYLNTIIQAIRLEMTLHKTLTVNDAVDRIVGEHASESVRKVYKNIIVKQIVDKARFERK